MERQILHIDADKLLYVGRKTIERLKSRGIYTIGDIASADVKNSKSILGKSGEMLYTYANGLDNSPVARQDAKREIKSISNSVTTFRNLENIDEVKMILYNIADSVAYRARRDGVRGNTVSVYIKNENFESVVRQKKLDFYTDTSREIAEAAIELFSKNYVWDMGLKGSFRFESKNKMTIQPITCCHFVLVNKLNNSNEDNRFETEMVVFF